jgi:hypothetical protein
MLDGLTVAWNHLAAEAYDEKAARKGGFEGAT